MTALLSAILAGMALEAAALLLWRARTGRGPTPARLLPNLAAGASLLLAMLLSVQGFGLLAIAACLAAALVAHIVDLRGRWGM